MGVQLFVGNLNLRTTKSQLMEFFSAAGRVVATSIPIDRDTGQPRGFCFVEFADRETAEQAFEICEVRELDGRKLRLSWARDKQVGSADQGATKRRGPRESLPKQGRYEPEQVAGGREPSRFDDFIKRPRAKPLRHGGHGSDRKNRRGTRRVIE